MSNKPKPKEDPKPEVTPLETATEQGFIGTKVDERPNSDYHAPRK